MHESTPMSRTFPLALVTLLAASCALHRVRDENADVRAAVDRLVAADNRCDLAAAVASYADDATMVPPAGRQPLHGRTAIRASYIALFEQWKPELEVVHVTTTIDGSFGVDRGETRGVLVSLTSEPDKRVHDEYEATLRREDGAWKVVKLAWRPVEPRAH